MATDGSSTHREGRGARVYQNDMTADCHVDGKGRALKKAQRHYAYAFHVARAGYGSECEALPRLLVKCARFGGI